MLGHIRDAIVALATAITVLMFASLYNTWVDDPAVRRAARQDLVEKVELEAERAKAGELRRQVEAGAATIQNFQDQLALARRVAAEADAAQEQEIRDYEQKLSAAGRSCLLDRGDIDFFLRQP